MMKFKIPKKINILGSDYKVIREKSHSGGTFDTSISTIRIGTKTLKSDPCYTFQILVHEISELVHVMLKTRYDDYSVQGNYKFFMDHKEFESHNQILNGIIYNQIIK